MLIYSQFLTLEKVKSRRGGDTIETTWSVHMTMADDNVVPRKWSFHQALQLKVSAPAARRRSDADAYLQVRWF